ncbi:hypothetical protein [Undibacterium curvum]|uniref:hypothetical protein n=1 Tax=Undibacterium curvum TaxID=2762294 RepID=UPI003D14E08C
MTKKSQSQLERAYYEDFELYCPIAPKGEVTFSDKPDIVVKGANKIGIEIANIYLKDGKDLSSEQIQSKLRFNVIQQAKSLYLTGMHPSYAFFFDFDPNVPITNTEELSKRVYQRVLKHIQEQHDDFSNTGLDDCPELRYISNSGTEKSDAKWDLIQCYDVPDLSTQRVREIVAAKASKVARYQSCDRYWLLLVIELWDPAQDQHPIWNEQDKIGPTPFERIIIYKPTTKEWLEVPQ